MSKHKKRNRHNHNAHRHHRNHVHHKDVQDEVDLDNVYEEMGADISVGGTGMADIRGTDDTINHDVEAAAISSGYAWGWVAVIFAVAAWFIWPVLLGATAGIIGVIAFTQGARGLGGTAMAIGLGAVLFYLLMAPIY